MALQESRAYYLDTTRDFPEVVADGNGPDAFAVALNKLTTIHRFTPHIYTGPPTGGGGSLTEITYGTTLAREGWYQDDGMMIRGVAMTRLGSTADVGADGNVFAHALPVPADVTLGNGQAIRCGDVTLGVGVITHMLAAAHIGSSVDLANPGYAYFVPNALVYRDSATPQAFDTIDAQLWVTNTLGGLTSDGNGLTGWHDFHFQFSYKKA